MSELDPNVANWLVDVEGTQSGPFSLDQIRGLFEEGEILGQHKVARADVPAASRRWVTVEELFRPRLARNSNSQTSAFRAPPRPEGADIAGASPTEITTDVADSLFDALQAARERKAGKLAPPTTTTSSEPAISFSKFIGLFSRIGGHSEEEKANARLMKIIVAGLIVAAGVWGATKAFQKTPSVPVPAPDQEKPVERAAAPPPAALPKPAKPEPAKPARTLPPTFRGMAPAPRAVPPPPRPPGEDYAAPRSAVRDEKPVDMYDQGNDEDAPPSEAKLPPPIHSDEGIDETPPQESMDAPPAYPPANSGANPGDGNEGIVPPPPPPPME